MVALVTGGASGIGAAAARRLAAAGEHVLIVDRAPAEELARELGGSSHVADVTDPEAVAAAVAAAEEIGPLRTVLLNAGITSGQSGVEDLDLAGYRAIMGVNVDHVVFGTAAAVPALTRAGGGRIVATASLAGLVGMPGDALYTASKHAVVGYVRSAAAALAPRGITIDAVCPGFADTPLIVEQKAQFGDFPLLTAEDVADAIEAILERGEPGECWFVQPGRDPAPYGFRGVPGPKGSAAPPPLTWEH
ncbi:SDR family oxidoreductase [Pseudonocardia oroxyli]|uniref:Short-chain dehydrogenase n=1 Tax=Pseudonocardia oroxyli TaxID=366584 RepID=A0A1G7VVD8_PSEOR|nr:SDR family oxidoreductase [Pseudonocardia oroxyli]SDG63541.1 Short-chain dehydrogenase [Pseudonocardia oroxyli]